MTYGFAGRYPEAYYLLDSLLGVWTNWTPMVGIADSASMAQVNQEAQKTYRHLQHTYAKILVAQAQEIENNGKADSLMLFQAKEARSKANLFWESDRPELYNYYGYSLIDLNRSPEELDKGIMLVDKALSLEKGKAPSEAFLDSKAWGLYRKGKFEEALSVMLQIKSENFKDDRVYWEHMGAIQAAVGKTSDAVKSYKYLLKLKPNDATAKEFLKKHH